MALWRNKKKKSEYHEKYLEQQKIISVKKEPVVCPPHKRDAFATVTLVVDENTNTQMTPLIVDPITRLEDLKNNKDAYELFKNLPEKAYPPIDGYFVEYLRVDNLDPKYEIKSKIPNVIGKILWDYLGRIAEDSLIQQKEARNFDNQISDAMFEEKVRAGQSNLLTIVLNSLKARLMELPDYQRAMPLYFRRKIKPAIFFMDSKKWGQYADFNMKILREYDRKQRKI